MRLLVDENIPEAVVDVLTRDGHDVYWVRRQCPGVSDLTLVDLAARDNRLILTFDKDFGELAFNRGLAPAAGVILFRIPMPGAIEVARTISWMLPRKRSCPQRGVRKSPDLAVKWTKVLSNSRDADAVFAKAFAALG